MLEKMFFYIIMCDDSHQLQKYCLSNFLTESMDNVNYPELLKLAPQNHRAWKVRDMVILIISINYLLQINII